MPVRFLEGRRAWVTGRATGMGRAIASALAKAGADLAIGSQPAGSKLLEAVNIGWLLSGSQPQGARSHGALMLPANGREAAIAKFPPIKVLGRADF